MYAGLLERLDGGPDGGSLQQLTAVLGVVGNGTGLCVLLAPMPTFASIMHIGSTEEHSPAPYFSMLLNCVVWAFYGLPQVGGRWSVLVSSTCGSLIVAVYCCIFIYYAKTSALQRSLACVLTAIVALCTLGGALTLSFVADESRGTLVGIIGDITAISAIASPLAAVGALIHIKDVRFFPVTLCVMNNFNTVVWATYGILSLDIYLTLPNIIGATLAAMQVLLYFQHRRRVCAPIRLHSLPTTAISTQTLLIDTSLDMDALLELPDQQQSDSAQPSLAPQGVLVAGSTVQAVDFTGWGLQAALCWITNRHKSIHPTVFEASINPS